MIHRQPRADFWKTCWLLVATGLAIRLLLAPFTSTPPDVAVWYREAAHGLLGVPTYVRAGFSYPPVWAFPLQAIGAVSRWVALAPQDLGTHNTTLAVLDAQLPSFGSSVVTTPGFNVAFKLILFCFDLGTGWLVWRCTLRLTSDTRLARRAFALWWLSPLVIFESAVHGSFDTMAAFFVMATLLARIEGRFATCGIALALGVFTKAIPVFLVPLLVVSTLVPLPREPQRPVLVNLLRLLGGALVATVIVALPSAASGQLTRMVQGVVSGRSGPSGTGGIGLFGAVNATAFRGLKDLAQDHGTALSVARTVIDAGTALGVAALWPRWRRRFGERALLLAGALALAVPVFVQPRAQPQYLLWFLPPLCVLGAASWWSVGGIVGAGVADTAFELAVLSPLGFLAPLAQSTGAISMHSVTSATRWLYDAPGVIGPSRGADAEFLAWMALTLSMLCAWAGVAAVLRSEVSRGVEPARDARAGPPSSPSAVAVAAAGVLMALVVGSAGAIGTSTALHVTPSHLHQTGGRIRVTVLRAPAPVRLTAFASSRVSGAQRSAVLVYRDDRYPTAASSPSDLSELEDDLKANLGAPSGRAITTMDAQGLARTLRDTAAAPARVIVAATGTLPQSVWSQTVDLVTPWIRAGGILVWAGATPGLYSVGPAPSLAKSPAVTVPLRGHPAPAPTSFGCGTPPKAVKVVKGPVFYPDVTVLTPARSAAILGTSVALPAATPPGSGGCMATRPTSFGAALEIRYLDVSDAPTVTQLAAAGGLALGSLTGHPGTARDKGTALSSVSWLPSGGGGTVLFAGKLEPRVVAADITQILRSDVVRAVTPAVAADARAGETAPLRIAPAPPAARRVVVVGFDASLNDSFFERRSITLRS